MHHDLWSSWRYAHEKPLANLSPRVLVRTYRLLAQETPLRSVDYEASLNSEQLSAVFNGDGIVLILAGPGSGKTRTLVYRVAYLLERGVSPHEIMLATFTNRAAREMLGRVEQLIGVYPKGLWGGTFHHLGLLVLRAYGERIGYRPSFGVLDEEDSRHLVGLCLEGTLGGRGKGCYAPGPEVVQAVLSFAVNTQRSITDVLETHFPQCVESTELLLRVGEAYTARKRQANVLDYDDLLEQWRRLMAEDPLVRSQLARRLRYVLVDEFQDTNRLQLAIVQQVVSVHNNLMVVGDDAQGIYSFRGADIRNILEFPSLYSTAQILKLETNYRSVSQILHLANDSITNNHKQFSKTLRGTKPDGAMPVVIYVEDAFQQAACVAQLVLEIVKSGAHLNHIGVLFRAKYQSAELELELMRRGIPYLVRGGIRFFEQAHIKDVLAYLRVVGNPDDELSWKRLLMLEPGIGRTLAEHMWDRFPKPVASLGQVLSSLSDRGGRSSGSGKGRGASRYIVQLERIQRCLRALLDTHLMSHPDRAIRHVVDVGYRQYALMHFRDGAERLEDVEQLANFASGYDSYDQFLADVSLREGFKGERLTKTHEGRDDDILVLSTIHQAKGLEWSVVVVIGLAEGQFPHPKAFRDADQLEEERRLFYVAVTRAKDQLYLLVPMTRMTPSGAVITRPSLFLRELPTERYEAWRASEHLPDIEDANDSM